MLEVFVPAEQLCLREAVLEIVYQRIGIVAEHDSADPLVSGCDKIEPSEHTPTAKRIDAPWPPERKLVGVIPSTSEDVV